jgi:hypothetical protein
VLEAQQPTVDPLYVNVINKVALHALDTYRKRDALRPKPNCSHLFCITQGMICPCRLALRKAKAKIPLTGVCPLQLIDFSPVHYIPGVADMNVRSVNPLAALSIDAAAQSITVRATAPSPYSSAWSAAASLRPSSPPLPSASASGSSPSSLPPPLPFRSSLFVLFVFDALSSLSLFFPLFFLCHVFHLRFFNLPFRTS